MAHLEWETIDCPDTASQLHETGKRFSPTDLGAELYRYRFIECNPFVNNGTLRMRVYRKLPKLSYVAVSHVWDGFPASLGDITFEAQGKGSFAAGRIAMSLRVIQEACRAALKKKIELIWIDRLCMIQSNQDDINWQFRKMYKIYKYSAFCLVIPAGLAQIAALNQETLWINRGWTLQEAVAPEDVQVIFTWERNESWAKPHRDAKNLHYITHITPRRTAMAPLELLLDCALSGSLILTDESPESFIKEFNDIHVFGTSPKPNESGYKNASPSIAMLAAAISKNLRANEDLLHHCLWKCMLMRATKERRDMIISVMGSFGVKLRAEKYTDKDDCVKPAADLARELLKNGKGASWLGASFFALPCPRLSTFPIFPRFLDNKVLIKDAHGFVPASSLMLNEFVGGQMLRGRMDEGGYFNFVGLSIPVVRASRTLYDGEKQVDTGNYLWGLWPTVWELCPQPKPAKKGKHVLSRTNRRRRH
ncbi:heterokaryon incompatibility protein [Ceratobasidium sp. AG-Ba]|nr:heterokaryon incompatibility protein [Ceratobasidium sp. AG-Ba]